MSFLIAYLLSIMSLGLSMLLHVSGLPSFLRLTNILLRIYVPGVFYNRNLKNDFGTLAFSQPGITKIRLMLPLETTRKVSKIYKATILRHSTTSNES